MFLLALSIYMTLLSVSVANLDFNAKQLLQQYGPKVCPYTNFCHANATKVHEDTSESEPCCEPCSCEDTCSKLGNCCPDKHTRQTLISAACKDTLTKQGNKLYTLNSYFVVDHCPAEEKNTTLREKCQSRNKSSVEDYVWVSDKLTGKIFENKYCALCNGVGESLPWSIRTTCKDVLAVPLSETVGFILSHPCAIINEAPEMLMDVTNRFVCHLPEITQCNETGAWEKYDRNLDIACNALMSTFVYENEHQRRVFKNLFCFICNMGGSPPTLCQKIFEPLFVIPSGFTALFDFAFLTQPKESNTVEGGCDVDEVLDSFTALCRKLSCQFGSTPYYGRCIKAAKSIIGFGMRVQLYMTVLWNHSSIADSRFYDNDREQMGEKIATRYNNLLWLKKAGCNICGNDIVFIPHKAEPGIIYLVDFVTTITCQLDFILAQASILHGKQADIRISKKESIVGLLNIETRETEFIFYDPDNERIYTGYYGGKCIISYTLDKVSVCPEIELRSSEVTMLRNVERKHICLAFFENNANDNNETANVCLDNYFSALSRGNAANVKSDIMLFISSLIMSLLLQ